MRRRREAFQKRWGNAAFVEFKHYQSCWSGQGERPIADIGVPTSREFMCSYRRWSQITKPHGRCSQNPTVCSGGGEIRGVTWKLEWWLMVNIGSLTQNTRKADNLRGYTVYSRLPWPIFSPNYKKIIILPIRTTSFAGTVRAIHHRGAFLGLPGP